MGDKEWRNGRRAPTQDPSTNDRWLSVGAASFERRIENAKQLRFLSEKHMRMDAFVDAKPAGGMRAMDPAQVSVSTRILG